MKKIFLAASLVLAGIPFLSAYPSGRPGLDMQTCLERTANFISNPADRTVVCECAGGQRSDEECKRWENEIQRLLTADYPSTPPPPPPDRTPSLAVCLSRASFIPNPADRTVVCECLADMRPANQCSQWQTEMTRILTGDYPSQPAAAPDRTPSISECLTKAARLPDLTATGDRTAVCECLAGIRTETQCERWKDAMRRLTIADYSLPNSKETGPAEKGKKAANPFLPQQSQPKKS